MIQLKIYGTQLPPPAKWLRKGHLIITIAIKLMLLCLIWMQFDNDKLNKPTLVKTELPWEKNCTVRARDGQTKNAWSIRMKYSLELFQ